MRSASTLSAMLFVAGLVLTLGAVNYAWGTSIPIVNPGFDTVYKAGSVTVTTDMYTTSGRTYTITGSYGMGGHGHVSTNATVYFSDSTSGTSVDIPGWISDCTGVGVDSQRFGGDNTISAHFQTSSGGNHTAYQVLGVSALANSTYVLSMSLGNNGNYATPVVNLYAGGTDGYGTGGTALTLSGTTGTAPGSNVWQPWTYTYTTGSTPPSGNLEIVLGVTGSGDVWVDNVALNVTTQSIPEPSTLALLAAGLAGLLAYAWRKRR